MSKIWEYFKKEAGFAFCKNCDYKPNFPPQAPTTTLVNHLKHKHSNLYKEFATKIEATKEQQPNFGIKRAFSLSASTSKASVFCSTVDEEVEELTTATTFSEQPKIDRTWTKSPWEMDGEKAITVNKKLMEFIAVDLQPFSVVEDVGFKRLISELQPKYRIPGRTFFTEKLLPDIFNSIKRRIRVDLCEAQYISYTTDCWSSTDGAHSLLCLTAHFVIKSQQKFVLLAAKPIKGRHNAPALRDLIRDTLEEFDVEEKSFLVVRDAAEVMVKTCDDLGLKSIDCFAHKINLILSPIFDANNLIQARCTTISTVIPLFRVIIHALEKDQNDFPSIKKAIIDGLKRRMEEKRDARQNVKREAWYNNRDLVLATILDPRFKLSPYLEPARHDDYINWLIGEAEKLAMNESRAHESPNPANDPPGGDCGCDIFSDFEKAQAMETELLGTVSPPIPTAGVVSARQRAEVEVFAYLDPKIYKVTLQEDPLTFWTGENAVRWPLLTNLAQKYFSAPATSAESERLFSTAGQILTNLRKKLLVENVEKLLFLHHNIKLYDFMYE